MVMMRSTFGGPSGGRFIRLSSQPILQMDNKLLPSFLYVNSIFKRRQGTNNQLIKIQINVKFPHETLLIISIIIRKRLVGERQRQYFNCKSSRML